MSESGKTKKLKLNPPAASSRGGTPQGSRAASPAVGNQSFGSRASSPDGPIRGESLGFVATFWPLIDDVLTAPIRPRSSINTSSFWRSNISDTGRNSCGHSAVWHSQQ